jgi:hypothetical protein
MADIWNVEPPRWLQADAKGIDTQKSGELFAGLIGGGYNALTNSNNVVGQDDKGKDIHSSFMQTLGQGIMAAQDPFYMEKAEAMRANAELTHATTADKLKGMKEYPEWMKETGGDWKKVLDTPFTGTSQYASELVSRAKQNAWMRSNQEQSIEVRKQDEENKIGIQKLKVDLDRQKLDEVKKYHEGTLGIRQQNADTAQEKADREAIGMASPETKEFADGSKLIHVSPNRWQYVNGGATKGMSTRQLMDFSKYLKDLDPKDTTASTIDEALKSEAVQQVKGVKGVPVKPAMGGYKVGATYRGMKYLGGDPNDESNWQK